MLNRLIDYFFEKIDTDIFSVKKYKLMILVWIVLAFISLILFSLISSKVYVSIYIYLGVFSTTIIYYLLLLKIMKKARKKIIQNKLGVDSEKIKAAKSSIFEVEINNIINFLKINDLYNPYKLQKITYDLEKKTNIKNSKILSASIWPPLLIALWTPYINFTITRVNKENYILLNSFSCTVIVVVLALAFVMYKIIMTPLFSDILFYKKSKLNYLKKIIEEIYYRYPFNQQKKLTSQKQNNSYKKIKRLKATKHSKRIILIKTKIA